MSSKLITLSPYESQNPLELSLRQSYTQFKPNLTPPLKLKIFPQKDYLPLNKALIYGILCEPILSKSYIKYLHAIINDGYCLFIDLICEIIDGLFLNLLVFPKTQLIWVVRVLIDVCGVGFDRVFVCLLRQICGGDFGDGNLWLCYEIVKLFLCKFDLILDEMPDVLCNALYVYLRLLSDHCRLSRNSSLIELIRKEIEFCVKMLREQFHLCLRVGRDLVRLLQDLVRIQEFRDVWKDLVLNPKAFRTVGFSDISDLYCRRTPSEYFLLRISPEMESQLRFLLTHVKLGCQKRHQMWFARKFLYGPERETIICDIVRFVCCAHYPSKEVLQSDVIPRWAVIGWLLKLCTKKYVEANVKLALFYDWLFFDEEVDNFMNVEPAMLLMVNSIPKYIDLTNSLLEFLLLVVENYDMERRTLMCKGVSSAIGVLVSKGVISSLDVLTSCKLLSPIVRNMLQNFMIKVQSGICKKPKLHENPSSDMALQTLPNLSNPVISLHLTPELPAHCDIAGLSTQDISEPRKMDSAALVITSHVNNESHVDELAKLIGKIGELMTRSSMMGQQLVEKILLLLISPGDDKKFRGISSEFMACELKKELELGGYKLFSPFGNLACNDDADDEVQSVSATIVRTFVLSQHHRIKELLIWWSRNNCLVGARLLSYALRLALEAHEAGGGANATDQIVYTNLPLLKFHIEGYFALKSVIENHKSGTSTAVSKVDKKLVSNMVDDAFSSYRAMLHARVILSKEINIVPSKLLSVDVVFCSLWRKKCFDVLFSSLFFYLPDVSLSEDVIHLLVSQLEDADLVSIQINLGLKRFAMFGEDVNKILKLIRKSVLWKQVHQYKFWGLIRSELTVSKFPVEKLLLDCFFSTDFDLNTNSVAVEGLLALCSSCAPTAEIVGAVMFLPNNKFPDFSASILAHWTVTNASAFSNSFAEFINKFENKNGNSLHINQSALLFLVEFFEAQGVQGVKMLETLASKLSV